MNNIKKPIIGIIGYIENIGENKPFITVDECFRKCIILSGGIPITILPTQKIHYNPSIKPSSIPRLTEEEKNDLEIQIDMCDGILLPGGSQWYEHHEYIYNTALKKDKCIFGICLGMQAMIAATNRKYGDGSYKNVKNNTNIDHKNIPSDKYAHWINIKEGTILHNILGTNKCQVNSRHNYHIADVNEYIISCYSEDGIPEAIELPNKRFVIGVQWHPEKLFETDINSKKLFSVFINSCKNTL